MNLDVRRQKSQVLQPGFDLVNYSLSGVGGLLVSSSLVRNTANRIFDWSNRQIRVCARFGQENGASEGETLEQPRDERILKKFPKTFKVGFLSIHISSNSLPKTLLTKWR